MIGFIGFDVADDKSLPEVVAHTTSVNVRSEAVMRHLGIRHRAGGDFDGPWYPVGHPHRRFVLYRLTAHEWCQKRGRIEQLADQ